MTGASAPAGAWCPHRVPNPAQCTKGRGQPLPLVFQVAACDKARLAAVAVAVYLAGHRYSQVTHRSEPFFNVPSVVIVTIIVLVTVHATRMLLLTEAQDTRFLLAFAFIPARYQPGFLGAFPGGIAADVWTFFTYAFLHANLIHIGLNVAWLLPFGTALARRFGPGRYVAFMLVMAAAGALAHLVSHPGAGVPMIGASAAISGAMAAAMRFVFQQGGPLGAWRATDEQSYRVPAASLLSTLGDMRFLLFLGVWIGLNALFGLGTMSIAGEEGQQVAWQAHIGGFFAGLLLFNLFDPVVPDKELDASFDAAPHTNPDRPLEPRPGPGD